MSNSNSNNGMSDDEGKAADWFIECTSIGRELNKHERRYNEMLNNGDTKENLAIQLVIVNRIRNINEETCANAEK